MFYEQSSQPPHSLHPQHDCTTINHDLVYNSSEEIRPIDFFDLNTWKRLSANWTLLREEIIEFEEIYHVPSLSERYGQKPIMYRNNDGHFIRDEIIFEETDPIVIEDILNEVIQINGVYKYQRTISRSRHEKRVFKKLKKRSVYLTEVAYQQYTDATNLQSDERTSATGVDSVLRDNLEILDQPHQLRYITEVRLPPAGSHAIISNEQEIKMTPSVKTTLQPQEKQRPLVSKMLTVTDVFKQPDFTNSNRVENGLLSDIIRWHLIENDNTDAHYDFENDKDEQHNVILTETSSQNEPKLTILNELINWHHDISDSTVQFNSTNAEVMQPNHAESTFSNIEKGYYQAKKENFEDDNQDRHIVEIDSNKLMPDVTECQQSSNTSQYATIVQPYQISSKDSIDRSKTNIETVNFKDFILPHNTFEQMMEDDYANEKDDKQTTKKNEISIDLNTDLDVSSSETNDLQNFSYSTTIFENENVLDRIWPSNILQKKLSSACETEICPSKISYGQNADHLKETAMPKSELHKVDLIFSNSDEVRPSVTGHGKERDPVLNSSTDEECDSIEHISAQVSKEIIPESSKSANDVCDHEPFEPIAIALQRPNITTKAKHLMALQRRDILSSNLAFLRVRNQNLKIKRYLEFENELDSFSNDKYNKLNCKMLSRVDNCRLLVTVSDKHLVSDSVDDKMDNTVKETLAYRDKITQNIADGTDSKTVPPCVIGVKHYYHPLKNTIIRNYLKNILKTWQKSLKVDNCKPEICEHEFSKKLNKSDNSEEMKVGNEVKSIDKAKTRLKYLNYLEPTGKHYHSIIKNQIEKPQLIERNVLLSTNIISSEEVNNFEVVDSKQDAIETTVNKIENDRVVQNVVEYNAGNEIIETNEGNVESEDEQEKHTNYIENIIFSHKNFNTFKAPEQIALITPQETAELVYTKESDNTSEDEQEKHTNYIGNIIFNHKNFNTFKAPEQIALITHQETAELVYTKESDNTSEDEQDKHTNYIGNIIFSHKNFNTFKEPEQIALITPKETAELVYTKESDNTSEDEQEKHTNYIGNIIFSHKNFNTFEAPEQIALITPKETAELVYTKESDNTSEDEQEKHTNYIGNIIFSHKNFNTFKAPEQIALITHQETAELVYTKESDNTLEDEQDKHTNYIGNIIFSHKNFNTFKEPEQIALITPKETAELVYTKESNIINVIYDYSYQFISNIISSYLSILENDKRKLSADSKPEESFALAVEKYRLNETNEEINNDATELLHQSSKDDILSEPSTENIRRILLHHKTISDMNAPCTLVEQLPCQQIPTLIHKSTFETDNVDAEQLHRIKCNETACDLKSSVLDDTFDCEYHNDLDIQQPHSVYSIRDIIASHRVFSNMKLEKPSLQHLVQAPLRKDKDNNDGIQTNKIDRNLSKIQNVIVQEPAMNRLAGKLISNISHIMLAHVDNISVKSIPAEVVVFDSETKEISDNNYINSVETKDHIVFTNNKTGNFTNRASADTDYSKADITACNINLKSSCSHISSLLENHNQLIKGKCLLNVAKSKPEANDHDFHETEFVTDEKVSANKNTDYQGTKKANDHEIYDDSSWISTDDLSKISNENESEEFRVIEKRQESSRVEDDKESMEISEIQEDDFSKLSLSTSTSSDNGNLNLNIIDILICHHNFKPLENGKNQCLLTDEFNTNNDLSVDQSEPLVGTRINNYYEQQFENNNSVESLVLKDTPIHPIMRNVKYINLDKFRSSLSDSFRECFSTSLKTSDMDNDVTNIMLPRVDQIVYQRMHSNNDIPATDIIPLYAEVFELGKRLTSVSADSSKMPTCTQESTLIEGENNESEKSSLIEASTVYDQLNNEITQFTESIEKAAPSFHGKDIKDSNTTTTIDDFTNPLFSNGQSTRERESNEHRLSAANAYVLQDLCSEVIKPDTDAQATKFTRNEGIDSLIKEKTHTVVNGKHLSKIPVAKIKQIVTPSYTKTVIPESVQTDYSDNKSQAKLSKNLMVNTSLDTLVNRGNELKHKIRLDTDQLKQIKDKLHQDLAIINKDNISDPANNQQSHHTSKQSLGAPHVRKTRLVSDHKGKQQLGAFYNVKHPVEAPYTNKQRFEADHDVKHSLGQNNGENKMQTGLKSSNRISKLTEKVYSSRNDSSSSSSSSGDKEKATNQLIRERRLREAQKKLESFQPEYVRNWLHSHKKNDRNRTDPNKCSKNCDDTVSDDDDLLNDIVLQKVTSSSSKQFDTSSDSSNNNSNSSIRQRR
ncbi:hypothetical protein GJ496_007078 [Pomphorhynchus laevis]|nr:hypothetical protein GJ496_007078 [Pomphorhynchus laevis]